MRGWSRRALALSLAAAPVPILAQGLGMNASDGEAFLKAIKDDDANKAVELASQPGVPRRQLSRL